MEEFEFQVVVDPKHDGVVGDTVVAFGTFKGPYVYTGLPALGDFYSDLIMGKPFPLKFLTRSVDSVSTLLAIALFLNRQLAIHPRTPDFIVAAHLVEAYGESGCAHITSDMGRFFELLKSYLPEGLSLSEQHKRLATVVEWIFYAITEDAYPALPPRVPMPELLDVGTVGFVLAKTQHKDLRKGWVELFRQGFLKGALVRQRGDRLHVLAARKSLLLAFDLLKGADVLNEAEAAMGEPSDWKSTGTFLYSPVKGTLLPLEALVKVLVRL